jgi:2-dehydro-3-deoxyglucarate aldolase
MQVGHPAVAEIFASIGFDWVCVDLEHGVIGLEIVAEVCRALRGTPCVPVARLPVNDPTWIHRVLDAGARGLIIPMVKTADEAEQAIRESKYPPRGGRGFGYSRANLYGMRFESYRRTANRDIAMVMQIEHRDAIVNLDDILEVSGVDGVFIGPLDLSGSMGRVGDLDHPAVRGALDTYLAACRRHKISAGMHVVRPDAANIRAALKAGYTCLALGLDVVFLEQGARTCLRAAGRKT